MRTTTGLDGLDKMIEGGFPQKTAILLSGGPGTGKTLFGLNFLIEGAKKDEKCCYLSLSENEEELKRAVESIDSFRVANDFLGKNLIFKHMEIGDELNVEYFMKVISSYPKLDRIVIDNVNKLFIFAESKRNYRTNFIKLIRHLKEKAECSLILCETMNDEVDTGNGEAFECDGVINLSFSELEEKPKRMLQVYKLRYTSFDARSSRELNIDRNKISLSRTKII